MSLTYKMGTEKELSLQLQGAKSGHFPGTGPMNRLIKINYEKMVSYVINEATTQILYC